MRRRINSYLVILAMVFCVGHVHAYTWYVNATNTPPGSGSLTDPYTAITSAVAALAATNAIEGTNGGHTISVAAGTYTQQVTLTSAHRGQGGSSNTIIATGEAIVDGTGANSCFYLNQACHFIIDGFKVMGAAQATFGGNIYLYNYSTNITIRNCKITEFGGSGDYIGGLCVRSYCDNVTITNCNIYNNNGNGMMNASGNGNLLVDHCNIYGNKRSGIFIHYSNITVRNCNIINHAYYGIARSEYSAYVSYCNFYGNRYNFYGELNTADEINSQPSCSNNIVAHPGFSALANNWNFNALYSNSPCLNAGEGGSDIGSYQNPPTVALSNATYYVAATGDDNRTAADAQNPSTPWATISNATRYAAAGDTVVVANGIYTGQVTLSKGGSYNTPVTYQASNNVIVDGDTYGFYLDRVGGVVLDGFKVTGCSTSGIYVAYSFDNAIRNITTYSNSQHGINLNMSSLGNLESSGTYGNAVYGIYVNRSSSWTVQRCAIYRNGQYGIYMNSYPDLSSNRFWNCNIYSNGTGVSYGGLWCQRYDYSSIENSDICYNKGPGLSQGWAAIWNLKNTILSGNTGYGAVESGDVFAGNCCFYGNATNFYDQTRGACNSADEINACNGCTNNIVGDPLFVNPAAADFHFPGTSPCVDAGTPTSILATDMYGNKRVFGRACDIGSFEYFWRGTFIRIGF